TRWCVRTVCVKPACGFSIRSSTRRRRLRLRSPATFLTPPLSASAAVYPTPVVDPLAPSRSTAPAPVNTIERRVGEIVAAAGMAIVEALDERQHGALSPRTKMRGGDLICELFRWRKFLIADYPTFDAMAREHGAVVLRAAGVSPVTADLLASEVLDLLGKV